MNETGPDGQPTVMLTARECIPGTRILVFGHDNWAWCRVARWEGRGDGYAALYGQNGRCYGTYKAGELFHAERSSAPMAPVR